jgi:hypothetical protein
MKNIDRDWYGAWAWAVRAGYRAGHVRGWGTGDLRSQAFLLNFPIKFFMCTLDGFLIPDSGSSLPLAEPKTPSIPTPSSPFNSIYLSIHATSLRTPPPTFLQTSPPSPPPNILEIREGGNRGPFFKAFPSRFLRSPRLLILYFNPLFSSLTFHP